MQILRTTESSIGIEAISRVSNTLFARVCRWFGITICERKFVTTRTHVICGITISRGFEFDGASVPWLLRIFFNPRNYLAAALVHDYLYHLIRQQCLSLWACIVSPKRLEADRIFARAVVEDDHRSLLGALTLYSGLRPFGWTAVWSPRGK